MIKRVLLLSFAFVFSAYAKEEMFLEDANIESVSCKTIKGEIQQGDPDSKPEYLPDTYELNVTASYTVTENQQGDPGAPVEQLKMKEKKSIKSTYLNKAKFDALCERLSDAKKNKTLVNIAATENSVEEVNVSLLKRVTVQAVKCKKVKGEMQQGDPDSKPEYLPDTYEMELKVSYVTVEEQQGDAHAPVEQLRLKETKNFKSTFLDSSKQAVVCKKLQEAKKKGKFVDLLGWENAVEGVRVL